MAMIKCPECGKEISDLAEKCPNCGFPLGFNSTTTIPINTEDKTNSNPYNNSYNNPYQNQTGAQQINAYTPNQKNSVLGILALVFSILGCTFIVGAVLAIIDLIKKDGKKKICSIISLIICGIWLVISIIASGGSNTSTDKTTASETQESELTTDIEESSDNDSVANDSQEKTDNTKSENVSTIDKEEFITSCQEIPYKTLARNPDDYIGEHIVLTVKVSQVLQGGFFDSNEYYRVYTDDEYGMWLGDEYFMYDSRVDDDTKILQDDIIKVYAEFAGTETVERALTGTKEDVLSIKAIFIELIEDYDSSENYQTETSQGSIDDGLTMGQKNALSSAKSYLSYSAFSYQGLINQLEYEQYSHEDAVYAADNCGADWNEQAALAAKSYLEYSSFSREGLINQLEYEGFTNEQAIYGVEANGY